MKETLQIQLQEEHYKEMLSRYHFNEGDLDQLMCLGEILLRTAEPVMYCAPCRIVSLDDKDPDGSGTDMGNPVPDKTAAETEAGSRAAVIEAVEPEAVTEGTQLAVIVSLGAKVDALQNEYISKERLTESYMIECIGMELLKKAYEQTAEKIRAAYGLWMSGFFFLGDRYPLELTEAVFRLLAPEGIAYNQAFMLTPKKTVVFMATLQKERKDGYCHVCDTCTNLRCPNRQSKERKEEMKKLWEKTEPDTIQKHLVNLNYGYQRIFGKP